MCTIQSMNRKYSSVIYKFRKILNTNTNTNNKLNNKVNNINIIHP